MIKYDHAVNGFQSISWFVLFMSFQVITFIDLAGHERYLKTTVFGMTGHAPDFAMLMVRGLISSVLLFLPSLVVWWWSSFLWLLLHVSLLLHYGNYCSFQTCHSSRFNRDIPIFQYKFRSIPISRFHVWKSQVFVSFRNWKNKRASHFVAWPLSPNPQSLGWI